MNFTPYVLQCQGAGIFSLVWCIICIRYRHVLPSVLMRYIQINDDKVSTSIGSIQFLSKNKFKCNLNRLQRLSKIRGEPTINILEASFEMLLNCMTTKMFIFLCFDSRVSVNFNNCPITNSVPLSRSNDKLKLWNISLSGTETAKICSEGAVAGTLPSK